MSEDRVNTYKRKGSRVYGNGISINCTNIVTAEALQNQLNSYETQIRQLQQTQTIQTNQKQIHAYLVKILMDLSILQSDINTLKEAIQCK